LFEKKSHPIILFNHFCRSKIDLKNNYTSWKDVYMEKKNGIENIRKKFVDKFNKKKLWQMGSSKKISKRIYTKMNETQEIILSCPHFLDVLES